MNPIWICAASKGKKKAVPIRLGKFFIVLFGFLDLITSTVEVV